MSPIIPSPSQVYCLSSLDAYGLVKIKPCFVLNVGHDRIFRIPVSNKAWDKMNFDKGNMGLTVNGDSACFSA